MRRRHALALAACAVLGLLPAGSASAPLGAAPARPADGRSGLVSAAHPLATAAGLDTLRSGGNAFDAAVAIAAALNVVEPAMSGLGGYGTILVYHAASKRVRFLNPSGRIPAALDSDVFRPPTPDYLENRRGAKSVSTPGNLHAWEAMSKAYGTMPWARLLEPAIGLAAEGFVLDDPTAASIRSAFASFPPHAQRIFGRDGRPLVAGERLVQADLARSLQAIAAEGAAVFYGGPIGEAIDRAMRDAGGFLSIADLNGDRTEWWDPIRIPYRGYDVYTAAPPANAFDYLVRLGLMSQFNVRALRHNSTGYLHRFAEATKHGFWVRLRYAGDPEIGPPPLDRLLSEPYWKERSAKLDLGHASVFAPPANFGAPDSHTTHFVVADRWGNVVSATQTLGNVFGARLMPEGTGIWLNNSLAYCTFEPKGNPMDAHPGRRKLSGDCPTIILKGGRVWAALGTPGGHTIGQTVAQMVMNLVDFQMDIARAIAAPRISFVEPDDLAVEESLPLDVRDGLARLGHHVVLVRALGNAHGLTIQYGRDGRPSGFRGAADPRGHGLAQGY